MGDVTEALGADISDERSRLADEDIELGWEKLLAGQPALRRQPPATLNAMRHVFACGHSRGVMLGSDFGREDGAVALACEGLDDAAARLRRLLMEASNA